MSQQPEIKTQLSDREFRTAVKWLKRWREEGYEAGNLDPQIVAWCVGDVQMLRTLAGEDDGE